MLDEVDQLTSHLTAMTLAGLHAVSVSDAARLATMRATLGELITSASRMVFGLAATERWRRLGLRTMPVDVPQAGTTVVDSPTTDELAAGGTTGTFRSRVAAPVAAGVKADVARLKTAVGRGANHNGSSAPTLAEAELTSDTGSLADESQSVGR